MALLSFDDARQQLLASAVACDDSEACPLSEAWGRILASDIAAPFDVPGFDNSAMDGYAIRMADYEAALTNTQTANALAVLPISQRIAAGDAPTPLKQGTAARIFTGAPLPAGADTVVMQEDTQTGEAGVTITARPKPGQHVRKRGNEMRTGDAVMQAGSRLGAGHIGLAASLGLASLKVRRRLRVALFFTGNELVEPGLALGPGQIYNSNRYLLRAFLQGLPIDIIDLGVIPDNLEATRTALRTAAAQADVILTSGGMSVGDEDHVKPAVEAEGELTLWKIAVKPGKPVAFGRVGSATFIGLPGNPVAVWVAGITLLRPYLRKRLGMSDCDIASRSCIADFTWKGGQRREFLRVRLQNNGRMTLHPNQDSSAVSTAAWASGLADIPAHASIEPGDSVAYWPAPEFND